MNLVFCVILSCCGGSNSSSIRYSYLSILTDDNADAFVDILLMPYCNVSSPILSSMVLITLYISSSRFFRNRNRLYNGRAVSMTKNEHGSAAYFLYGFLVYMDTLVHHSGGLSYCICNASLKHNQN